MFSELEDIRNIQSIRGVKIPKKKDSIFENSENYFDF